MRFYRDWYRPDLMAVIVVGDVDRDAVAAMITAALLVARPSPSPERPRPAFDVPEHPGTRYAIVTDKETTATAVQLSNLRPARNQGSVGGYREHHARPAVRRACSAPGSTSSARARIRRSCSAAAGPRAVPDAADEGRGDAAGARLERRRRRAASTRSSPSCSASRASASRRPSSPARSRR